MKIRKKRIFSAILCIMIVTTVFTIELPGSTTASERNKNPKVMDEFSWKGIGPHYGSISSIAVSPSNPSIMYCGMYGGHGYTEGVFKSVDHGTSWKLLRTFYSAFVAIHPQDPNILYVATGMGLYKTVDGGDTWIELGKESHFDSFSFRAIVVARANPDVVYVACYDMLPIPGVTDGSLVYMSQDSGSTWTRIGRWLDRSVRTLAVDPNDPGIIYAGTSTGSLPPPNYQNILKSTDYGATWTQLHTKSFQTIYSLAIDPTNTKIVYAGTFSKVLKTRNGGKSWVSLWRGLTNTTVNSLALDPTNTKTIYASCFDGGIRKSENGGRRWYDISEGLSGIYWHGNGPPIGTSVCRSHSVAVDPANTNTIFAGTEEGIFKSVESGLNWQLVGVPVCKISHIEIDAAHPNTVFLAMSGGAPFVTKSTDYGDSWIGVQPDTGIADVMSVAIDPTNSDIVYAGTYSGRTGMFKSEDGGTIWNEINNGLEWMDRCIESVEIHPFDTNIIFIGTADGVFKSINAGELWMEIGLAGIHVMWVETDPVAPNTLYAATYGQGIFKSTDGGDNWYQINEGLTELKVSEIAIDPSDTNIVYASTFGGGVFKSTDSGLNWSAINAGLTNLMARAVRIDPIDTNIIYVGIFDSGVYRSDNAGSSWTNISANMENLKVMSLAIDPSNTSIIYAGTFGGSAYKTVT